MNDRVEPEAENRMKRERSWKGRLTWVFAVAAILFLSLWGWTELRLRSERENTKTVAAEKGMLEGETHRLRLRDRLETRRSGQALPNLRKVVMEPVDEGSETSGRVFLDESTGSLMAYFQHMEPAPEGMTYQLWFHPADGAPESVGRVTSDEEGEGVILSAEVPAGAIAGEFRLTLEQAGGAMVPTGRELLQGSL